MPDHHDVSPLLEVLDVRPAGSPGDAAADVFTGPNLRTGASASSAGRCSGRWRSRRADGGARTAACTPARLLPASRRPGVPVAFAVERLRDGRSFSARRVQATQNGVPILSGIASFQTPARVWTTPPAPDVPDPEDVVSDYAVLDASDHPLARQMGRGRHVELRPRRADPVRRPGSRARPGQSVWFRLDAPLPGGDLLQRGARPTPATSASSNRSCAGNGMAWATPGMSVASLDHAMWWHRPARASMGPLRGREPHASGARGLSTGRMYDRQRRLVATWPRRAWSGSPSRSLEADPRAPPSR